MQYSFGIGSQLIGDHFMGHQVELIVRHHRLLAKVV
jgi:hypothetical protein